ncbi:MAG: DAK2 domain-containing protein [Nocardioidaceae bacterium]|nr:DAK2 domain-containing protein [Nocardioidaceae bacterium]
MSTPAEVALLLRWCDRALAGLGEAREEIDSLNVYPVPDGDTGTNLYLTFEAARQAIVESEPSSLVTALTLFARGALLGARGNSGVILSQLMRAGAAQLMRGDPTKPGQLLADTLTLAADAAYDAVAEPVEGTMLTVARAAAAAAQEAVPRAPEDLAGQMGFVVRAAALAAREALERTPDQLEVLAMAGVVDAGGRGLCVIFDAAEEALTGARPPARPRRRTTPLPSPSLPTGDLSPDGPAYEVMYLLDADDSSIATMRSKLAPLGDSLVVVGGDGLWNVHVHVDDVGAAVEAGIEAGRPYRVRVTHFAEQRRQSKNPDPDVRVGRGLVVVAAGEGLASLFRAAGAVVVSAGPGQRTSTGALLDAIRATGCDQVIVLPNDSATIAVAEAAAAAARDEGVRAAVIPTRAQVQGLAAVAVHEHGRSFDDDVVAMTSAAGHTRQGAVTVAVRDAMTMAGPCEVGDSLGVVEGDFAVVGRNLIEVALEVVDRLLSGGGEMLTVVRGIDADQALVDALEAHVRRTRAEVEIVRYDGGQQRYPLLLGVE